MRRHSIFLRAAGSLVWTAHATIARIFLIAGASAFGRRCAPVNKRSAGKVPLAPIAGDFAIDLPPAGGCYFRSGPDTYTAIIHVNSYVLDPPRNIVVYQTVCIIRKREKRRKEVNNNLLINIRYSVIIAFSSCL
jgi:hypothetical protein